MNRAARVDRRLGLPWQVEVERTIGRCVAHSTGISSEVLVGHESVRIHCLGSRAADGQLDSDRGPDTLA